MYVVNLVLDLPLWQSYSYRSTDQLQAGRLVSVEFRGREQVAIVVECVPASEFSAYPLDKLSPLLTIRDEEYALPEHIWQLCQFAASYYHHPLGSSSFCALPVALRKLAPLKVSSAPEVFYRAATNADPCCLKSKQQRALFAQLGSATVSTQQIRAWLGKNPAALIEKWLAHSLIESAVAPNPATTSGELALNPEQAQIVQQLTQLGTQFNVGLLYGITGSGKTEVFLQLIRTVLTRQQQVLVLVPEINLTPQLASRFSQRFPAAEIVILNSEVSERVRLQAWLNSKAGRSQIVLGTRLAVFTPFANLGLIVVDEEHDDSFKQNDSLRYHARDLAIWRAKQLQIPILLSSATPSLESLYNYKLGKSTLYKLTQRAVATASLPQIELLNLAHHPVNYAGISAPALEELSACLARQELALVFINRRGYAPIITCYECGWVSNCRHCSSKMVYHHDHKQLKCHHCGYQTAVPPSCPTCRNQYLHTLGHGTQKLEEFLLSQFPSARIQRVDRDTTANKAAWHKLYHSIAREQVDILVGTQMLAKGHDFAKLTLVIGLNLDTALFSYDFRASEDMFNMLTQVAGRAGRSTQPGRVLLQTNYPEHPVYKFLQAHDFNGFINYTLQERSQSKLPPFSHYALVKLSTPDLDKLNLNLKKLKELTSKLPRPTGVTVNPPLPAVMLKLHNKYRGQMLIASQERGLLHAYLKQLTEQFALFSTISISVDVDPFEL